MYCSPSLLMTLRSSLDATDLGATAALLLFLALFPLSFRMFSLYQAPISWSVGDLLLDDQDVLDEDLLGLLSEFVELGLGLPPDFDLDLGLGGATLLGAEAGLLSSTSGVSMLMLLRVDLALLNEEEDDPLLLRPFLGLGDGALSLDLDLLTLGPGLL